MSPRLSLVLLGCPLLLSVSCAGGRPEPPAAEAEVRRLLQDKEFSEYQTLLDMGERAFPAFEAILSDPKAKPFEVRGVFSIVGTVKADRRRFVEHAVRRLADADSGVRKSAVWVLERIGTAKEASPVVALLSDENKVTVHYAAKTLAAIGGPREVVAMDAWLLGASHRGDAHLRQHVKECRDKLQKRLAEDPTKPKAP
jgi:hypothetical protein